MPIVRFATLCDVPVNGEPCAKRSPEYEAWPTCRACNADVCPAHQKPGSKTEADVDTPETCLCLTCEEP